MPLGLVAIRPKRFDILNVNLPELTSINAGYALAVGKGMANYPPQQPTRYKRTGNYGRGWTAPGAIKASPSEVTLVNRVGYSVYVGGPKQGNKGERQTKVMRGKGWKSITDVAREEKRGWTELVNRSLKGRPG